MVHVPPSTTQGYETKRMESSGVVHINNKVMHTGFVDEREYSPVPRRAAA